MIVSEASRMFSAISLGVFCREAPSTSAIIRSMKDSPGFWVISHDDPVGEHLRPAGHGVAVAAALADDGRALAGDRALVDAGDALDDVTVTGDHVARLAHDAVALAQLRRRDLLLGAVAAQPARDRVRPGATQRVGLGLAAAFGDRLREVGEHDGQPQPPDDQPREHRRVGDRDHRRERRTDLDEEHDRVAPQRARVELHHRVGQGRDEQPRVEQARLHRHQCSPSASGPSARAGK